MTTPSVELIQFHRSHYNEKVRWALDWKGVPHVRRSLLPGPHAPTILRLTGKTEVPVLRIDGDVIGGSAAILDALERRFPDPPLLPADATARDTALELARHFDDEVGPVVRRGFIGHILAESTYLCEVFASDRSLLARRAYRVLFPVTKRLMARSMGIRGPASIEAAADATARALDLVAERADRTGYLVGETFTIADLTAAALLAPAVAPDHRDMAYPTPYVASFDRWLGRFRDHPGAAWVRAVYARDRPTESSAVVA